LESDSRVMYTPSITKPGTGYLMYARAGNLLAHPFDPQALQLQGEALADRVAHVLVFSNGSSGLFGVEQRHAGISEVCQPVATRLGESPWRSRQESRSGECESETGPPFTEW